MVLNSENFYTQLNSFVKQHPATNNDFINRFSKGRITPENLKDSP